MRRGEGFLPAPFVMQYQEILSWVACLLLWSPTIYIIVRFLFFQHIPWTGAERLLWFTACFLAIVAGDRLGFN